MANYVISDLHGERTLFHRLLERIEFSAEDRLHILGDVVDRGEDPIGLLTEILNAENMTLLLGNHEYMCLQCYSGEATERDWRRWDRNNNLPTKSGLNALPEAARRELLDRLRALPIHEEVCVGGERFYLVHGFPGENVHDEVWGRPEPDSVCPIPGVRLIVGHTPVCCLGRTEVEEEAYCRALEAAGKTMEIFRGEGFWDIDCGCGYPLASKALACLRLEDMQEFYVF